MNEYFYIGFYFAAGVSTFIGLATIFSAIGGLIYGLGFFSWVYRFVKGFFGFLWTVLKWIVT